MSAARSLFPNHGLAGLRMTAEEYLAIGETVERYELIHGVVVMSLSPIPRHWKVVEEVVFQLRDFRRGGGKADAYSDIDLKIDNHSVLRPDICVYARAHPMLIPDRLAEVPDLVVEVISPGSEAYDLITKKDEYEHRGIKEYWVIDPKDARTRAWRRDGDQLIESPVRGQSHASAAVAGFVLDLEALAKVVGRPPA